MIHSKAAYLVIVILLTGCSPSTAENNKDVSENEIAFTRKQECQKYMSEIEKRLTDLEETDGDSQVGIDTALEKLFYSPKQNSCVYIWEYTTLIRGSGQIWDRYYLTDALSAEHLLTSPPMTIQNDQYWTLRAEFDEDVMAYEQVGSSTSVN